MLKLIARLTGRKLDEPLHSPDLDEAHLWDGDTLVNPPSAEEFSQAVNQRFFGTDDTVVDWDALKAEMMAQGDWLPRH